MFEYKFKVNVGQKNINCRAFTLREYKKLMESKKDGTLKDTILELIKNCTDAVDLNKQESELLLVKLWAESLGEINTTGSWVCSCGHEQDVPINISYAQMSDPEPLMYDFTNFQIKFRYPRLFEDANTISMVLNCIEYILVENEKIRIDDLNDKEIDDLYQAITIDDIEKITAMLLKPSIYLGVPISCECGKNDVFTIEGLKNFMRLL